MVSGHDVADSDIVTNGLWNNSAVINSVSPYHSVQPVHEPNNTGALSNIMTDSASRNASTENMQGGTSEPRASPARTTTIAINTSSAPHSLTPDDNSNPAGTYFMRIVLPVAMKLMIVIKDQFMLMECNY